MKEHAFRYCRFTEGDIAPITELIWKVFLEFEAPDYPQEGIDTFREFIEPDRLSQELRENRMSFYCCYERDDLIGVLAYRDTSHIALLFVDKAFHREGIAGELLKISFDDILSKNTSMTEITVHSSPYAESIYQKMGFISQDTVQMQNGIKYVPMKKAIFAKR